MSPFPPCPPQLKSVQHLLKLAADYETREPVISYWARLYALQTAMKIDRKSPEAKSLLASLMDWLEEFKKGNKENDGITSDVAAQALIENEAHKLFAFADTEDRAARFNKNIVKTFFTAGILFDVCEVFGELPEEIFAQRKYAKWKATYIHTCLKNGETPVPGPIGGEADDIFSGIQVPQPPQSTTSDNPPLPGFNIGGGEAPPTQPSHTPSQPALPTVGSSSPNIPHKQIPSSSLNDTSSTSIGEATQVGASEISEAQKCCKFAMSALDYEDVATAVNYLQKALNQLQP